MTTDADSSSSCGSLKVSAWAASGQSWLEEDRGCNWRNRLFLLSTELDVLQLNVSCSTRSCFLRMVYTTLIGVIYSTIIIIQKKTTGRMSINTLIEIDPTNSQPIIMWLLSPHFLTKSLVFDWITRWQPQKTHPHGNKHFRSALTPRLFTFKHSGTEIERLSP